jgi:endonuclease YncB( thermonuclease family)
MTTTELIKTPAEKFQMDPSLRDYSALKARVHKVLILGRKHIEREFMLMRYHTGLLINEHIRLNEGRAAYGAQSVERLGEDFEIDPTELSRYSQLAKAYPILGRGQELMFNLPWKHYRKLMIIKDDGLRFELTLEAEEKEWSYEEVEARVRYAVGREKDEKNPPRLPFVSLGPFFTYKVVQSKSIHSSAKELLIDLGFKHRVETRLFESARRRPRFRFQEGMIVTAEEGSLALAKASGATEDCLYTFKARTEEVLDGDTLKVEFLLGLGNRQGETIRLNLIDCPELDTPEGKAAKRFVESELAGSEFITVKSVRTRKEKWGRYLGDVFYARKGKGPLIYLNQLLLDKGHAVRMRL